MDRLTKGACVGLVLICAGSVLCFAAENVVPGKLETPLESREKEQLTEELKSEEEAKQQAKESAKGTLPDDTSNRFSVKEVQIRGNELILTEKLFENLPKVFNTSDKPLDKADPGDLYDFRILQDIINDPGTSRQISQRTMQGFTEYLLSMYRKNGYAGIYVYISAQAIKGGIELHDEILPIQIVESKVSDVLLNYYDTNRNKQEKGTLLESVMNEWSPVEIGETVKQKKLDDYLNLLNQNPDRHIAAVISRGSEPNSLALGYDIYEGNPWHFYMQLDNAGAKERQWAPRLGLVNTNVSGRDDKFSAVYQASLEGLHENYSAFGSYEFPLFGPRLRMNLYSGYSDFDISGGGGIDFLGKGKFYGAMLKLNVLQHEGWFFDVTTSLSRESSKVTLSLFPTAGSDVDIELWGLGVNAYRSGDSSNTSIGYEHTQSVGGSPQHKFWDPVNLTGARENAERHFVIRTLQAAHSQYLDSDKIQRFSASMRWITTDERVAPSKMTTFGGLYSVRGYEEDELVADGGLLLSGQYEFDLVKYNNAKMTEEEEEQAKSEEEKPWLRKLALLAFSDFARAKTKNPVAGEKAVNEICSVGPGIHAAIGDHCDARMYYGWPLNSTQETKRGQGNFSFSFIVRW